MRDTYRILREELVPHFPDLVSCRDTAELLSHPAYRRIAPSVSRVLTATESESFAESEAPARDQYRIVAWNLERGIQYEGQLEALRTTTTSQPAIVLLLDRDGCRDGAVRQPACRVRPGSGTGMHYAFAPCYVNLSKGAGVEYEVDGENLLGLHGNAILSRYPIRNVRSIPLKNGKDKMAGREKRLGQQTAIVADVALPGRPSSPSRSTLMRSRASRTAETRCATCSTG